MTVTIDCKECDAIYHIKFDSFEEKETEVNCPFCDACEKIKVGVDDE